MSCIVSAASCCTAIDLFYDGTNHTINYVDENSDCVGVTGGPKHWWTPADQILGVQAPVASTPMLLISPWIHHWAADRLKCGADVCPAVTLSSLFALRLHPPSHQIISSSRRSRIRCLPSSSVVSVTWCITFDQTWIDHAITAPSPPTPSLTIVCLLFVDVTALAFVCQWLSAVGWVTDRRNIVVVVNA